MISSKIASLKRIARLESSLNNNKTAGLDHAPKIGDIYIARLTYYATTNFFYEVIGQQGMSTFIIQLIDTKSIESDYNGGTEIPIPNTKNKMSPAPFKIRWTAGNFIKVPYGKFAVLWDGKPAEYTNMD